MSAFLAERKWERVANHAFCGIKYSIKFMSPLTAAQKFITNMQYIFQFKKKIMSICLLRSNLFVITTFHKKFASFEHATTLMIFHLIFSWFSANRLTLNVHDKYYFSTYFRSYVILVWRIIIIILFSVDKFRKLWIMMNDLLASAWSAVCRF